MRCLIKFNSDTWLLKFLSKAVKKKKKTNLRAKVLHPGPEMLLLTGCVVKEHWRPWPQGITAILHLAPASLSGPGWVTRLWATAFLPSARHPTPRTQEATAFPNNLLRECKVLWPVVPCRPRILSMPIILGENILLNHNKIVSKGKKSHIWWMSKKKHFKQERKIKSFKGKIKGFGAFIKSY